MANPSSRQGLIDYCLRQLGFPVIEINVDDDQLEDRVDEAFQVYREHHYDSMEFFYLKQEITASTLKITGVNASSFTKDEVITGGTSGATAIVDKAAVYSNYIIVRGISGDFQASETVTGAVSGATATLASSSFVTKGNYDNKYFEIADAISGVVKVLPLSDRSSTVNLFDVRYQLMLNNIQSLTSTDLVYYTQLKTHLNLINQMMAGEKPVRFNRHMNRLYVDMDWVNDVKPGDYIIAECFRVLDPDTYTDVYNDGWLKRYTTALIKRQWGNNMKKFEGVQLPGGVTMNGQKIFDEAVEEIAQLKQELRDTFELPPDMFVG